MTKKQLNEKNDSSQQLGLALLEQNVGTSAFYCCCTSVRVGRFSIWLLVFNFIISFSIRLQLWEEGILNFPQRQALSLPASLTDNSINLYKTINKI
ncbi:hypothetical protein [Halpernia sp. GG3]